MEERASAVSGGQGVHREMESEGHEEKYRAVIDGETQDEPVGQGWGRVESALLRRRRSHSPTAPRCLRTARYRRTTRDLRRLTESPSGVGVSGPISASEKASGVPSVVRRLNSHVIRDDQLSRCRPLRAGPLARDKLIFRGVHSVVFRPAWRPVAFISPYT